MTDEEEICLLCNVPMKRDKRVKKRQVWKCPKCGSVVDYPNDYGDDE